MKIFTEVEKTIARNIAWEYRWMARDQDGNLCIYEEKPKKRNDSWISYDYDYIFYFNHLFSAIQWEDEEPTRISDIYNPPVLNDAEREYLKTVLKPFHDEVEYVAKYGHNCHSDGTYSNEYLYIEFRDGYMTFPDFYAGEMYIGMELDKKYKLDELGITYEEENE